MAPNYIPFIVAPLIAFGIYRRLRSHFGRQPIRRKRMIARVAIFAVIACLMMLSGLQDIRLAEGALGGLALGGMLAWFGLRLTRFESGPDGDSYIPNPWIGGALSVLLIGRLVWRFTVLAPVFAGGEHVAQVNGPAPGNSPLTMLVIGLTIGYYVAYYSGLLLRHRQNRRLAADLA
ncbi:DUF1453 domain-containing protein [Luteibacter rhizovicinus]|nr:DUF1453 domain-containing protein [Luteibacter rhizovicinus]